MAQRQLCAHSDLEIILYPQITQITQIENISHKKAQKAQKVEGDSIFFFCLCAFSWLLLSA